jgi:hypothetical protein
VTEVSRVDKIDREITLPHPPPVLWGALTEAWFGARVELEARVGGTSGVLVPGRQQASRRDRGARGSLPDRAPVLPLARDRDGRVRKLPPGGLRFVPYGEGAGPHLAGTETRAAAHDETGEWGRSTPMVNSA